MPVKFNPFTGQLQIDQVGAGGGGASYLDGEVEFFSDLPLSAATAPLDSAWLVRKPEGAWFLTKKHAGLYIRTATGGTDRNADYTYAGAGWPDVFSDANFTLYDDGDSTKNAKFQLSGISTGTTRTLTVPDSSGTIDICDTRTVVSYSTDQVLPAARNARLIVSNTNALGINLDLPSTSTNDGDLYTIVGGATVSGSIIVRRQVVSSPVVFAELARITAVGQVLTFRAKGSGTDNWELASARALLANNGALTASAPVLDLSQTWNNAAVTFRGVNWSFVETAAGGSSEVFRISTGAAGTAAIFSIRRDGNATFGNGVNVGTIGGSAVIAGQNGQWRVSSGGAFGFCDAAANAYGTMDTAIFRDAADTLAMRRLANPQAFRLYNTTDAGLTNFERGFMRWSSNVLQIGTEAGGTGSVRELELYRGATRILYSTSGLFVGVGGGGLLSEGVLRAGSSNAIFWNSRSTMYSDADSRIRLANQAGTDFDRLQFGGTTSSFPALKRSSTALQVRLADDSGYTVLDAQLRAQGTAPATSGATGTAGDIRYDADYIYVCTAANTWKRAAIATW